MATMGRDLGILLLLIVVGGLWTLYSAVTHRGKRQADRRRQQAQARLAEMEKPLPGLVDYAAAHGWSAPGTDPRLDDFTADYVHKMIRHLWQVEEQNYVQHTPSVVHDNRYADVVTGGTAPRTWTVANAWIPVGPGEELVVGSRNLTAAVCVMELGETLPPLFVSPRHDRPFLKMFLKEVTLESDDFNRRYRVQALDRKYAMDILSPRAMELVISRNDWSFSLEMTKVVCVAKGALTSVTDVQALVDTVTRFVDLIPSFVATDKALHLPTLPDGSTLDPTDPASRARFEEAVRSMTPEQQQEAVVKAQAEGARFLLGMFGKDLPPGAAEEAVRRAAERRGHES
jgi:hypothetical protein